MSVVASSVVASSVATDPYASRVDAWETVPRVDPILWGDGSGPLSREELREFESDGYRFSPGSSILKRSRAWGRGRSSRRRG